MNSLLKNDILRRPRIFYRVGPIPPSKLDAWLTERHLVIPNDLKEVWIETGGGEWYESETILGPFGDPELGEDVDSVNEFHRQRGMPSDYLLFHTGGLGLTVVKIPALEYAALGEESYAVTRTFESLADWYENLIRKEFGLRYGLPDKYD